LAVGSWQLAVGSWQLAVGSWQLAVGSWRFRECKIQTSFNFQFFNFSNFQIALPLSYVILTYVFYQSFTERISEACIQSE
jgi:hypothetical protein